ncbi:MAG: ATPase [Oscillospiraceae bacterium]|nr:ATPase [Oscillospiraceae bacterium]
MAVMKMTSVTIAGAIYDFERVVDKYVIGKDIHLENAVTALGSSNKKLVPFTEDSQYAQIVKSISEIFAYANFAPKDVESAYNDTPKEKILEYIKDINDKIEDNKTKIGKLDEKIEDNKHIMKQLETYSEMDVELNKLFDFEFIAMRLGRLPKGSYNTLKVYLEDMEAIFTPVSEDEMHIWGMYFMPAQLKEQTDAVFASLYFERLILPEGITGTPHAAVEKLKDENFKLAEEIKALQTQIRRTIQQHYYKLLDFYHMALKYADYSNIRRKSAHTNEFFFLVGWMTDKEADKLAKELEEDTTVLFISEKPEEIKAKPPTKLKNPALFRPFEFFVKMYGMPSYGEMDPTPVVAISYIILFGIMFGDVGQSFLFFIGGLILYLKKKTDLAAIVSMVGVSGTVFGFIYGSVFGNETLLSGIRLIEPMEKISFMLGGAVVIGVFVILMCMVINIVNAVKRKDWGRLMFNQNGVAGVVFYATLLIFAASSFLFGDAPVNKTVMISLLILTFVMMFLQEPLSKLVKKRKDWKPEGGMFFVESFFEMFDVLLSFVTNTISFLRVGAFAIIHVGMMMVVGVLAAKSGGAGNIITMIMGNIIVMGLEGLIVGIQVLRLEYYEMFSRYYDGSGYEFQSIEKNMKN